MDTKYVAFLDVLGFKKLLQTIDQYEAEEFIRSLSALLYNIWSEKQAQNSENLKGYIVSDSIIVYTTNSSPQALIELLDYIMEVFNRAFTEKSILFRCGISKGMFNYLDSYSFENLSKGLVVGQAYVDAYLLEDQYKASGIIVDEKAIRDIEEHTTYEFEKLKNNRGKDCYLLRWANIDLLLDNKNLNNFIELAKKSDWLPHYYNTLYLFMCKSRSEKQIQVFDNIVYIIADGDKGQNFLKIDTFIENVFVDDVEYNFKRIFLKYLRKKL